MSKHYVKSECNESPVKEPPATPAKVKKAPAEPAPAPAPAPAEGKVKRVFKKRA